MKQNGCDPLIAQEFSAADLLTPAEYQFIATDENNGRAKRGGGA